MKLNWKFNAELFGRWAINSVTHSLYLLNYMLKKTEINTMNTSVEFSIKVYFSLFITFYFKYSHLIYEYLTSSEDIQYIQWIHCLAGHVIFSNYKVKVLKRIKYFLPDINSDAAFWYSLRKILLLILFRNLYFYDKSYNVD